MGTCTNILTLLNNPQRPVPNIIFLVQNVSANIFFGKFYYQNIRQIIFFAPPILVQQKNVKNGKKYFFCVYKIHFEVLSKQNEFFTQPTIPTDS